MVDTDGLGYPTPGGIWYEKYLHCWRRAFPGGIHSPGFFIKEDETRLVWYTQTPGWDTWWFNNEGVAAPQNITILRVVARQRVQS